MVSIESKETSNTDIYVVAGSPTFRGMYRQYVQSDYTLSKALKEMVDNAITKCDNIYIQFRLNGNTLSMIKVSDNYVEGFKNLKNTSSDNPLNLAHIREGQSDDNETSQFGVGLKAGSMSTANKMTIYSRTEEDGYFKVVSDYLLMKEEDTFNSKIFKITKEEYNDIHPFEFGSSIVLEDIKKNICSKKDVDTLKKEIIEEMSDTYNGFIKNDKEIRVNGDVVHYVQPLYELKECVPFTKKGKIYRYEEEGDMNYYMIENGKYTIYNNSTHRLLTDKQVEKEIKNIKKLKSEHIADIKTTFGYWCERITAENLPYGKTTIIRKDRLIGIWKPKKAPNGSKNYTQNEITIDSKQIAEELGLTYNKNVSEDHKNSLTEAMRKCIDVISNSFNADIGTSQFKKLSDIAKKEKILVESSSESESEDEVVDDSDSDSDDDVEPEKKTAAVVPPVKPSDIKPSDIKPPDIKPTDIKPPNETFNYSEDESSEDECSDDECSVDEHTPSSHKTLVVDPVMESVLVKENITDGHHKAILNLLTTKKDSIPPEIYRQMYHMLTDYM